MSSRAPSDDARGRRSPALNRRTAAAVLGRRRAVCTVGRRVTSQEVGGAPSKVGLKMSEVSRLEETPLDPDCLLVKAYWNFRYEKHNRGPIVDPGAATYVLRRQDGRLTIVFQLDHQDPDEARAGSRLGAPRGVACPDHAAASGDAQGGARTAAVEVRSRARWGRACRSGFLRAGELTRPSMRDLVCRSADRPGRCAARLAQSMGRRWRCMFRPRIGFRPM
jgi:hypothetical protein